ncbi:acyl-CoA synthetase [Candidatus Solincola sp.]|nr:long-chain fatty acid--CoA ligase [Actinomycetota bacterium]MDI7252431.1 long-chain fatty acid--CoA ligase [Actinomycetota bacterium]
MNVGNWATKRALFPLTRDKTAFISGDRSLTYTEFNHRVNQVANGLLEAGLKKGERVAALFFNSIEFMEVYFACAKAGFIFIPLNFRLTPQELNDIFTDTNPRAFFFHPEFAGTVGQLRELYREPIEVLATAGEPVPEFASPYEEWLSEFGEEEPAVHEPPGMEDPQMIMYTSGTTGRAKGAVLPHRKTFWNTFNDTLELLFDMEAVSLVSIPLFHSGGLNIITMPTFYIGGTTIFQRFWNPEEALRLIERHRVTHFGAVPTMLQMMLDVPDFSRYDLSSLKGVGVGGAPASRELLDRILERMKVPHLIQVFGCTETSIVLSCSNMEKIGSAGIPMFHAEVRVLKEDGTEVVPGSGEVGEICTRGPYVMLGYWNLPEETAEAMKDGWFHYGDLATVDEDGYVYIVDRKKDMIISGGENIYPAEVEKVLAEHPKVRDVAVIGMPDEKWGEVGHALVLLEDPEDPLSLEEMEAFCAGKLARYKIPKKITFVDAIPRTLTGKILKKELRRLYGGGRD